jgi:hypothetical protein
MWTDRGNCYNMSGKKILKQEKEINRHNHIYQIDYIDPNKVKYFIRDCLSLINETSIETLDCSVSWIRQKRNDISIDEVLNIIYESDFKHFSFILRKSYEVHVSKFGEKYWEFCASGEKNSVEYFFWIDIPEKSGYNLIEKYNLIKNEER